MKASLYEHYRTHLVGCEGAAAQQVLRQNELASTPGFRRTERRAIATLRLSVSRVVSVGGVPPTREKMLACGNIVH